MKNQTQNRGYLGPVEQGGVGLGSGGDGLLHYEEQREHEGNGAHHNVSHTEERVLATELTCGDLCEKYD